ncbi:MAG TPA: acyl-CoA dehydrogenase, partial [Hyphomonas sp.]|nr:acyl-CoA dehydrogenase [Hyphomonas sp.]
MTKYSAFDWADALSLASDLTEDERSVQRTAHDFAEKRLLPGI